MLRGTLWDKILLFAIPVALSSVLQQLFNSVDMAVVGRFASSHALAAVGSNGSVIGMFVNLFVGLSIGANVIIAKYIGSGDPKKVSDAVHTAMVVSVASGAVLLVVGVSSARSILEMMDTPHDVIELAVIYLRLYFLGMPFMMIYNFGAAVLRCIGDTRRPLYCLIFAGIINVVLNVVMVVYFSMSVSGVAIATVVSQIVSAYIVVRLMMLEKSVVRLDLRRLRINMRELAAMIRIGVPAGLQGIVFSISNVCIQSELNTYGASVVAGSAAALNFEIFSYFAVVAYCQAAVTFTGQNFGAGNFERCKRVYTLCISFALITTVLMSLIFVLCRGWFIGLYTNDAEVAYYASQRMLCVATFHFLTVTYEVTAAAMRGLGWSMTPSVITIFGTCALRLFWVFTVAQTYRGYELLLSVYPLSWLVTGTIMICAYIYIRKKMFAR